MSTDILNFIDGVGNADFATAKSAFDSMMTSKIRDAIDAERIQVASKFYSDVPSASDEDGVTSEEE